MPETAVMVAPVGMQPRAMVARAVMEAPALQAKAVTAAKVAIAPQAEGVTGAMEGMDLRVEAREEKAAQALPGMETREAMAQASKFP